MTATKLTSRISLAFDFVRAALQYWLRIYPLICREANRWQRRAEQIPNPTLHDLALEAQRVKRGNIEGSAAFAVLAPHSQQAGVIRAQVAFQSVYDYVDTLSEQPADHPIANSRRLHQALLVALDPAAPHRDYYRHQPGHSDAGYLQEMVDTCREALARLPSYDSARRPARCVTGRIVAYQSLNLPEIYGGHRYLARWAMKATPPGSGLRWWETAASAGSSLGLFALIAASARADLTRGQAMSIEAAYWPWIGALHSLLDSLVDGPEDSAVGQRNLLDYYRSPEEAAGRLELLAANALHATRSLPSARQHALILAGMASSYLTTPEGRSPAACLASRGILETLGAVTIPSMLVFELRRSATRLSPGTTRSAISAWGGLPWRGRGR
jgi:tetraprenyl-beta-curcumene synthase